MNNVSYLKTKSATILWFIKFVTGVLAAYMIFMTVKAMMPAFKAIGETAQSFDKGIVQYIQYVIENSASLVDIAKEFSKSLTSLDTLSIISFLIILVYMMITPLLSVIDAIGTTTLRYKESGAKLIKATHTINAVVCLVIVIETVVSIVMLNVNGSKMASMAGGSKAAVESSILAFSILMGIGAFIFLLLFCYHKDIARVMTTVDANIKGIEHKMKRTHLSGISFLFGLFMALILFVSFTLENKTTETWIGIVGILGITLKQFLVSINNRNIKQYNK